MSLRKILLGALGSTVSENQYRIPLHEQVAERILRRMEEIERAQYQFAGAMTEYAV
mgnify:CR=1 FL=1